MLQRFILYGEIFNVKVFGCESICNLTKVGLSSELLNASKNPLKFDPLVYSRYEYKGWKDYKDYCLLSPDL